KNKYDLVVVGSDQVWRPKYSPNIYNFFVDFIGRGGKSISYAASFGVDEWEFNEKQTFRCKELIRKFDAVSVREQSAITLCKEKFDSDAELVVDPTLLILAKDYETLVIKQGLQGKGKVLKYVLDEDAETKAFVNNVAQL